MLINQKISKGFTLIELIVVVVMISIIAAIAFPSYQEYVRKAGESQAQQEIQNLAMLLEKSKNRNFNYLGFEKGTSAAPVYSGKYEIKVRDGDNISLDLTDKTKALGQSWVIVALTSDAKGYNYLLSSKGLRCKDRSSSNIANYKCNSDSEAW